MRSFAAAWVVGLTIITACLPDNPVLDDESADETGETGSEPDPRVEDGLLGCPSGQSCTIVAVSQTVDDRVDLFTGFGAGPRYRGSLDLDLKPNPGGDISGENLDEPYGLAWDGRSLHVLVGHYPTRELGSLLSFPAASLAGHAQGTMVPNSDWFAGGTSTTLGVRLTPLDRTEPLSLLVHPGSGALLIATFANDLMLAESTWTAPSELLEWRPDSSLEAIDLGCAGAWSIVALDEDADAVAVACDGDESVVIVDTDPLVPRCTADIPFSDKRVRYLAPDGLGGVIVGENPVIVSANEDARIWWFDGSCKLRGFSVLDGAVSWELRQIIPIPSVGDPRWLLARADVDQRGVVILAGDTSEGSVTPCGRIDILDQFDVWTALGGQPMRPLSLALTKDSSGLAVGVGPLTYENAGPGYGQVHWVELDATEEACDRVGKSAAELTVFGPSVDPQLPQTWRRAPEVIEIIEVAP